MPAYISCREILLYSHKNTHTPLESPPPHILMVRCLSTEASLPALSVLYMYRTEMLFAWKDLKDFLDGGTEGVVYFSLGSNVRSETMSEEKKQVFLSAFAEIPQRVLWKWEANYTSDLPSNMKLAKWLPQQEVLGESTVVMGR